MEKTVKQRIRFFGLLCLLLLFSAVLPAMGQNCPSFAESDFTTNLIRPHKDCGTPGEFSIRYRNNIAGVDKVRYQFSLEGSGGPYFKEVEAPTPGATVKVTLPQVVGNQWIYVRITTTCGTNTRSDWWAFDPVSESNYGFLELALDSRPAGNGVTAGGSVVASVTNGDKLKEATFRLYDANNVLKDTQHSNRPHEGVTFFNVPMGTYRVTAEAKPLCTPLETYPRWVNDHFELSNTVSVASFKLIATPLHTRGNCKGGIKLEVSKISGAQKVTYFLKGDAPFYTWSKVTEYPNFTHTFTGLPAGYYDVEAVEDRGGSIQKERVEIKNETSQLSVRILNHTVGDESDGAINVNLTNNSMACPAKLTLKRTDDPSVPPIVKENVVEEVTLFNNLSAGTYEVRADYGGEFKTSSFGISKGNLGSLEYSTTLAESFCDPSGSIRGVHYGQNYMPRQVKLFDRNTQQLVRQLNLPAEQSEFEIKNLVPNEYRMVLRYDKANLEISQNVNVGYKSTANLEGSLDFRVSDDGTDFCGDKPLGTLEVKYNGNKGIENAPNMQKFMNGATYEIYDKTGKFLCDGAMPQLSGNDYSKFKVELAPNGSSIKVKPTCGYPVILRSLNTPEGPLGTYRFDPSFTYRGCQTQGTDVDLRVYDFKNKVVPLITYTLKKKTGELVGTYEMKDGVNTAIFADLRPGDYTVEWYPQCNPAQKHNDEFTVEDKVKEKSRNVVDALCEDGGYIKIDHTSFSNINAWRNELIRKSDNKLLYVYGTSGQSYVYFQRVPAGEYIVKSTPIVDCDDITPGVFEVTVGQKYGGVLPQGSVYLWRRETDAEPFERVGRVHYYTREPFSYVKWRVFDVSTDAEISHGEVRQPTKTTRDNLGMPIDKLPHTYRIEFETPCGTISRIDSCYMSNRGKLPGFDLTAIRGNKACNKKPALKIDSRLKAAKLPDRPSKIKLFLYENGDWNEVAEESNATAIIESHTFEDLLPERRYRVMYFYDGTSDYREISTGADLNKLDVSVRYSAWSPLGNAVITVTPTGNDPGATMKVVVKSQHEKEIYNQTVSAQAPLEIKVQKKDADGQTSAFFDVTVEQLTGCSVGETFTSRAWPSQSSQFKFELVANRMQCKNDGEIKMIVPAEFQDVSQIHYKLTKKTGTPYVNVAETTKPSEPKSFIGLEAGTYEVSGRATVLEDENGKPQVYDFKKDITLTTPYGDGLHATVRPDYMQPTAPGCTTGRIGLNIEKGSGKYRVYLTSTPDGPVEPMREIFTDAARTPNYNKLWGENLKAGKYSLLVKDGCMERVIPEAEILEIPNLGKAKFYRWYMSADSRLYNKLKETRDSFYYELQFDPSDLPTNFQQYGYKYFEAQIVAKGAPAGDKWDSQWYEINNNKDGQAVLKGYQPRFNNCDGVDILLRLKNCPNTVRRMPTDQRQVLAMFSGSWQLLNCDRVQWVFTNGEIGHKYHIKVTRKGDNHVMIEKDVTYKSREEYLTSDPDLNFSARARYEIEMTPTDYCGNPLQWSRTVWEAVRENMHYELDDHHIMSDCDGRLLAITGWHDCKKPMKYFVYKVEGGKETLVSQSGNFVPGRWYSDYKFMYGSTYTIRAIEAGKTEQEHVVNFTLNKRFPSGYKMDDNRRVSSYTYCGQYYDAAKKGYNLNNIQGYFGQADFTGVAPVSQSTYTTVPKMTIVYTKKDAPQRKFVATRITRYSDTYMERYDWKEELPDGRLIDEAYAPDGVYSVVARTVCGDIPMDDEYIGRPTADLSESTIEPGCDGRFTITPKGTVSYLGSTTDVEVTTFYVKGDNLNTTRNWGESFHTYQKEFTLVLNVKRKRDGKVCAVEWPFSMSNYVLDFDQSKSLSMFCTDSGKGIIHMALKGGQPPYTYKLLTLDGTEIETQTVPGAVDFLHGKLGQRFRIKATDACNLTWINQEVLLQDPAAISSSMEELKSFCAGDRAKLTARFFPNSTYEWHFPNGSTKMGQEIEFEAKTENAGEYRVDIHLTTCTVTLKGKYTVGIASVREVDGLTLNRQSCTGEPVEFKLDPAAATIDGENVDQDEIEYQWERTATPDDEDSWTPIPGATQRHLTYTAPAPGVYYIHRTARVDNCRAVSKVSKLTVIQGINVAVNPDELFLTITNKDPFTLTAGVVTGNPNRTYLWQRSSDKKNWVDIGNGETFTETKRFGNTVYYRRIVSSGVCRIEGQPITVRFKKRWPAYVNPQLRQRALDD